MDLLLFEAEGGGALVVVVIFADCALRLPAIICTGEMRPVPLLEVVTFLAFSVPSPPPVNNDDEPNAGVGGRRYGDGYCEDE